MNYTVCERNLLIIEDDENLMREMVGYFSPQNRVFTASDVEDAVELLRERGDIDVVVLDLILKNSMGMEIFNLLPQLSPPVIILSSLDSEDTILTGLTSGAVDYIVKPCSMRLLEAHIAMRLLPKEDAIVTIGAFSVNAAMRTVKYRGKPIVLTPSEFNILFFLVKNRGIYFTADKIYEEIWCAPSLHTTTIRTHLSSLRRKLKAAMPDCNIIRTEFNKGYCFTGEEL